MLKNPTMRDKLSSITRGIKLPSICTLCNQFHKGSYAVCSFCIGLITPLSHCCQNCAYPLPQTQHLICGSCIKKPPHFDRSFVAYPFEEPLRGLIHRFKYQNSLYLSSFLGHLMWQAFPKDATKAQCLIPVPMHPERIKQRGFNQAAILTKFLAKQLELPYIFNGCKKIINTAPQASLDGKQRQKNLQNAFQTNPLPYQHIIIVDDLLTTGSTANELAYCFKQSGVQKVDLWACARAVLQPKKNN